MSNVSQLSMENMLSEATSRFNIEVNSWEEAVLFAGNLLVDNGGVEERYPSAMVEWVKKLGPYTVIAPGVAIPHARPEDGALVPCMSLVTLKKPVNFGSQSNDPVKLVIAFATTSHDSHIIALTKLARVLEHADRLKMLMEATNFQEVAEAINVERVNYEPK